MNNDILLGTVEKLCYQALRKPYRFVHESVFDFRCSIFGP